MRGLLQGNLAATARSDEPVADAEPLEFSRDSEAMVRAMFGRTRAVRMQTAALSVTPAELTFLDELAPLLTVERGPGGATSARAFGSPPGPSSRLLAGAPTFRRPSPATAACVVS